MEITQQQRTELRHYGVLNLAKVIKRHESRFVAITLPEMGERAVYVEFDDTLAAWPVIDAMADIINTTRPDEVHVVEPNGRPSRYTVRFWWD